MKDIGLGKPHPYEERVKLIAEELKGKVLDVGCCAGSLHKQIKQLRDDCKIYGLDIIVNEEYKNDKDIMQGDAQNMKQIHSKIFDTVVAGEVIEHLNEPENFIKEACRILKLNGRLILTTNNKNSLINRIFHTYEHERTTHRHIFIKKELIDILKENDLKIEKIIMMPYISPSYPFINPFRIILHYFLPESLRENFFIIAIKK